MSSACRFPFAALSLFSTTIDTTEQPTSRLLFTEGKQRAKFSACDTSCECWGGLCMTTEYMTFEADRAGGQQLLPESRRRSLKKKRRGAGRRGEEGEGMNVDRRVVHYSHINYRASRWRPLAGDCRGGQASGVVIEGSFKDAAARRRLSRRCVPAIGRAVAPSCRRTRYSNNRSSALFRPLFFARFSAHLFLLSFLRCRAVADVPVMNAVGEHQPDCVEGDE